MTYPMHIGYVSVEEMVRTLPSAVRTIYLSPDTSVEPIGGTRVVRIQKRVLIQTIETPDIVRYTLLVIGQVGREVTEEGKAIIHHDQEAALDVATESALIAIEEWLRIQLFEVERAQIAQPTHLAYTVGKADFLAFDEITNTYFLKPESEDDLSDYKM